MDAYTFVDGNVSFRSRLRSPAFYEYIYDAAKFLLSTPIQPFPPPEPFTGGSVYLIYYTGSYEPYSHLAEANKQEYADPIYAGKAVPPGWRQARSSSKAARSLFRRLCDHENSIRAAENLEPRDFSCRLVILKDDESDMITTVEASLIHRYRPLWNSCVDGFGNHDPGVNRYNQRLAEWDVLHPGRRWERKWEGTRPDHYKLLQKIRRYFG